MSLLLYKLPEVTTCKIIERENRFVIKVLIENTPVKAYNTNTGRLIELIKRDMIGICTERRNKRKTSYTIHGILLNQKTGDTAIIDTTLQMRLFEKAVENQFISWLGNCSIIKRNPRLGKSRLDYLLECNRKRLYIEIKSAVLKHGENKAGYPDCLSLRGRRHIEELIKSRQQGIQTAIIFIAGLPGIKYFEPYDKGDPKIRDLLKRALSNGVIIKAIQIYGKLRNSSLEILIDNDNLPIIL